MKLSPVPERHLRTLWVSANVGLLVGVLAMVLAMFLGWNPPASLMVMVLAASGLSYLADTFFIPKH